MSDLVSIVLKPKKFVFVDGEWIEQMNDKPEFLKEKNIIYCQELANETLTNTVNRLVQVYQDEAIESENNPIVIYTNTTGINKTIIDTLVVDREYLYKIHSDVPEFKNVSTQKLSTKTKEKLKKAIKKSDLYDSAFFYFGTYPTDYASRTLKKELKDLLKDIIEIMETDKE